MGRELGWRLSSREELCVNRRLGTSECLPQEIQDFLKHASVVQSDTLDDIP